ncbi:hypothetical protein BaRGS_00019387 [Batillaria attramentaria]|uniref:Uncharacterized protein n=1 Tax=Batillaria attramentaria TaxID=370345 RepID=A0ABD0KQD3_9CAEN
MSTLPNGFLAGVPMTTLIVDNNHLTTIEPDAFTNSSLVAFKMDHNRFTSFPTEAFQRLTRQVRVLYLSYNSIDKISAGDAARMNIAVLDLTSNPLKTVEAGGFAGSTVGTLTLKNTQLTTLPEEDSAVWTSLTKLDLGGVVDWECDCDSLWLANYLAGSAGSVGPTCSAATTGKDMKSSVAEIEAMCLTTTTTTETAPQTPQPTIQPPQTTQQPPQTQPPIAHTQQPQTQAPVTQTQAPATQTQAPVSQTPSPQIVTPLPQTQAPVPQTQPPQTHTQQPQTQAPQTQAPLTQTPLPQTPVPPTQAPLPQTPVQQTQAPVAQAPAEPAPKSEDDNTTNMGLIIGTVMGLSAAICCAVIAICAIQLSKSALAQSNSLSSSPPKTLQVLQATRVSPSSNESFGRDPESQRDYVQRKSKVKPDDAPRQQDRNYDRDNFDAEDPDPGMWPYDRPPFPRPAWMDANRVYPA